MKNNDLYDRFVEVLYEKTESKKELINLITDTLCIERESASRRLSGKVLFTIREMEKMTRRMDISLDGLMYGYKNHKYNLFPMKMDAPYKAESLNDLTDFMVRYLDLLRLKSSEILEAGVIFDSLPIEFWAFRPHLLKFMYFKWGHYMVGTNEFSDFESWTLPQYISDYHVKLQKYYDAVNKAVYIWNPSSIWNLVKEIKYFMSMEVLTKEDVKMLVSDLKMILEEVELSAKGLGISRMLPEDVEIYLSNVNIGLYSSYMKFADDSILSFMRAGFMESSLNEDKANGENIKTWIASMKKICTLISGSGEKVRRLFFKEQHEIVDSLLQDF